MTPKLRELSMLLKAAKVAFVAKTVQQQYVLIGKSGRAATLACIPSQEAAAGGLLLLAFTTIQAVPKNMTFSQKAS